MTNTESTLSSDMAASLLLGRKATYTECRGGVQCTKAICICRWWAVSGEHFSGPNGLASATPPKQPSSQRSTAGTVHSKFPVLKFACPTGVSIAAHTLLNCSLFKYAVRIPNPQTLSTSPAFKTSSPDIVPFVISNNRRTHPHFTP